MWRAAGVQQLLQLIVIALWPADSAKARSCSIAIPRF